MLDSSGSAGCQGRCFHLHTLQTVTQHQHNNLSLTSLIFIIYFFVIVILIFSLSFLSSNSLCFSLLAIFAIIIVNVNHTGIVMCKQAKNMKDTK